MQQQADIVQAKRRRLRSKTDVTTTAAYDRGGQENPQNAGQITFTSTCVWLRLEELQVPPTIVNAIFMEFVRIFGEPAALRLFQEEWLKDLHDRWVAFAMFVQERRPADDATSVIPLVFSEFQEQVFALIRLVQSSRQEDAQLSLMLHRSDEQHLALLAETGHVWKQASGHENNCLIHSLAIVLDAAGYIACTDVEDARATFHDFRVRLVRAPRLHPLNANGKKDAAAYLQHNLHAGEIVRKFLEVFGRKPPPAKGFVLHSYARYDDMAGSPPDCIILCGQQMPNQKSVVLEITCMFSIGRVRELAVITMMR